MEHSEVWSTLKRQGLKHKREKAVLYTIIVLLVIALVITNIIWRARHNNETANAVNPEIKEVVEVTEALPPQQKSSKKKEYNDSGG